MVSEKKSLIWVNWPFKPGSVSSVQGIYILDWDLLSDRDGTSSVRRHWGRNRPRSWRRRLIVSSTLDCLKTIAACKHENFPPLHSFKIKIINFHNRCSTPERPAGGAAEETHILTGGAIRRRQSSTLNQSHLTAVLFLWSDMLKEQSPTFILKIYFNTTAAYKY